MPQWDFLNFLAEQGRRYPRFHLRMQAEATGLIEEDGRVAGVRAKTPDGDLDIRAALVVGCDGRHSTVRETRGLEVEDVGAPIDVLWFRLSRQDQRHRARPAATSRPARCSSCSTAATTGSAPTSSRRAASMRCKREGLAAFRERVVGAVAVPARPRRRARRAWTTVKLLTVTIDRLRQWHRPGLLCIGDAAHAMSPVGGVGINLAVQDAVAAANILAEPLRAGAGRRRASAAVQERREFPMRVIQRMQVFMQNNLLSPALASRERPKPPLVMRLMQWFPVLRRIPARLSASASGPSTSGRRNEPNGNLPASIRSACRAACGRRHGPRRRNTSAACPHR